jgi:hypothetical protein
MPGETVHHDTYHRAMITACAIGATRRCSCSTRPSPTSPIALIFHGSSHSGWSGDRKQHVDFRLVKDLQRQNHTIG